MDLLDVGGGGAGCTRPRRSARPRQGHRHADGIRRPRHPCAVPRWRRRAVRRLKSDTGDPPDGPLVAGEFLWLDIFTRDPKKAAEFIAVLPDTTSASRTQRRRPRASRSRLAASRGQWSCRCRRRSRRLDGFRSSRWTTLRRQYAGRRRTAARSNSRPGPDYFGGHVAVIADPQGGVLGIVEADGRPKRKGTREMRPHRQFLPSPRMAIRGAPCCHGARRRLRKSSRRLRRQQRHRLSPMYGAYDGAYDGSWDWSPLLGRGRGHRHRPRLLIRP